jgi:hypothetical protein
MAGSGWRPNRFLTTTSTTAQIQALPLEQLEALLDVQGPADLAAWLGANA